MSSLEPVYWFFNTHPPRANLSCVFPFFKTRLTSHLTKRHRADTGYGFVTTPGHDADHWINWLVSRVALNNHTSKIIIWRDMRSVNKLDFVAILDLSWGNMPRTSISCLLLDCFLERNAISGGFLSCIWKVWRWIFIIWSFDESP